MNKHGFGSATSGCSKDGLDITQGMQDTLALTNYVATGAAHQKVYVMGVSEGVLISAKPAETGSIDIGKTVSCAPLVSFQPRSLILHSTRRPREPLYAQNGGVSLNESPELTQIPAVAYVTAISAWQLLRLR